MLKQIMEPLGQWQNRLINYHNMLKLCWDNGWYTLPLGVVNLCDLEEKVLGIYHYVKGDLEFLKELALFENSLQISSSYVFSNLNPVPDEKFILWLLEMGHEPVLHLELISLALRHQSVIRHTAVILTDWGMKSMGIIRHHPHDLILDAIRPFNKLGIRVNGIICPDKSPIPNLDYKEYSYFSNYYQKEQLIDVATMDGKNYAFKIGVHPMAEYGFDYLVNEMILAGRFNDEEQAKMMNQIQTQEGKSILRINPHFWSFENANS